MDKHGFAPRTLGGLFVFTFQPGRRPVIVANPAGDREFRALIESSL